MWYLLYRYEDSEFDSTYKQKVYIYDFLTARERYDLKMEGWRNEKM